MSSTAVADVTVDCLCFCHSRVTVHPSMKKIIAMKKIETTAAMIRSRSLDVIVLTFPINRMDLQFCNHCCTLNKLMCPLICMYQGS